MRSAGNRKVVTVSLISVALSLVQEAEALLVVGVKNDKVGENARESQSRVCCCSRRLSWDRIAVVAVVRRVGAAAIVAFGRVTDVLGPVSWRILDFAEVGCMT